jgi:hypothetical protein
MLDKALGPASCTEIAPVQVSTPKWVHIRGLGLYPTHKRPALKFLV